MSDEPENVLKRCEEGHVFDVTKTQVCPVCGSPPAGGGQRNWSAAQEQEDENKTQEDSPAKTDGTKDKPRTGSGLSALAAPVLSFLRTPRGLALAGAVFAVLLIAAIITGRPARDVGAPIAKPSSGPEVIETGGPVAEQGDKFDPATADPYGLWEMYTPVPGQSPLRHVFEIRPDGTYTIDAGPYSHAGRMTFTGKGYYLKSQTSYYEDSGAYSRPDADTIVFEGRFGRSVWTRVKSPGLFDVDAAHHDIPKNVAAALARMKKEIRDSWRPDAEPVSLTIERSKQGLYELKVSFISPSDKTGMSVTWGRFRTNEFAMGGVSWFDQPLPEKFIDPGAAAAALGTTAPVKRAELGYFDRGHSGNTYDRAAPPSWSILPEAGQSGLVDAGAKR